MSTIALRRLRPDDSIDELTAMLRRAFARLGASGMNCTCVEQTPDVTRQRIGQGDCVVALAGPRIVGTVTLQTADPQAEIAWYRHPSVASLHQLAVEPVHQGTGVGKALLHAAEDWAFKQRCVALALDTPEPALHLHAYYARQGFSRQSTVQIAGRTYRSAVFSKPVRLAPRAVWHDVWPPRRPGETALLARQQNRSHGHEAAALQGRSDALASTALGARSWPR
ncbi:MAG: GNAT family N-acetyltransferase [Rubrivivax sp.]|nr:GNAT family N-acetyltransferase [Rubrivivax sp.]